MSQFWSSPGQYGVQQALSMSLVGDKTEVHHGLQSILRGTDTDEIMVNGQTLDHRARLHSFEPAMDMKEELLGQYVLTQKVLSEIATLPCTIPDKRGVSGIVQAAEMSDKAPLITGTPATD